MHKAGLPYSSRTCFPSSKTAIVAAHRGLLIATAYTRTDTGAFSVAITSWSRTQIATYALHSASVQSECETNHTPAWARNANANMMKSNN